MFFHPTSLTPVSPHTKYGVAASVPHNYRKLLNVPGIHLSDMYRQVDSDENVFHLIDCE